MVARKRIIATDMEIPRDMIEQVSKASGGRFEVRKLEKIGAHQRTEVEVLVLVGSGRVNKKLFKDFPKAKLLQSMSAGVDFIDISSIPSRVTLCSNAGAYKEPIAEHVFAMILFFAKNISRNQARLRNGNFEVTTDSQFLAGKTMGIVGAGGIGQTVARVAKAFNMKTVGINTSGSPAAHFDAVWKMDRLDDLLKLSDFVIISIPLSIHTRNLIDARRLRLMKENAILVNVARGPIISQADLYAHLKSHPEFKVGNDVWWVYPKKGDRFSPDFPFFELPNFLGSPHVADGVPESASKGQRHAFENLLRFVEGKPLERVIDKSNYKGFRGARHP